MNADDDGFIQPRIVMRTVGASDDDLKVLLAKRFLLPFESGVVVIKHWLIHNLIQKDRYHATRFQEEKKLLSIKENKAYTDSSSSVNKMLPQVRLGKVSNSERSSQPIQIVDEIVKAPKQVKTANAVYEPLLKWAEEERGTKFVHRTKQYKALGEARGVGVKSSELKERWLEMVGEEYWQKNGFDWTNVVASFNRKGV